MKPKFLKHIDTGKHYHYNPILAENKKMKPVFDVPKEVVEATKIVKAKQEADKEEKARVEREAIEKQGKAIGKAIQSSISANFTQALSTPPMSDDAIGIESTRDLTDEDIDAMDYKDLKAMLKGNFTGNPSTGELRAIAKQLRDSLAE